MKHRGVYPTSAGMHCLWSSAAFTAVKDYDSWAKELEQDEDIERHIRAGEFVPLNIGSDGAMEIEIRVGTPDSPAALDERETQYLIVASQPYLLRSTGVIGVSGIEEVSSPVSRRAGSLSLPKGDYAVTAHLIAWDEEPGMQTDDGPAPGALPDYLVLINPAQPSTEFRTTVGTFK